MANQVVYLVLCERAFSRKLAFLFLEELAGEFTAQYGTRIQTASRPYSFIEFDNFIQKCKKQYTGMICSLGLSIDKMFHVWNLLRLQSIAHSPHSDSRSGAARRNTQLNALSSELQDVQRIAVENIHDVLHRGEALSGDLFALTGILIFKIQTFVLISMVHCCSFDSCSSGLEGVRSRGIVAKVPPGGSSARVAQHIGEDLVRSLARRHYLHLHQTLLLLST